MAPLGCFAGYGSLAVYEHGEKVRVHRLVGWGLGPRTFAEACAQVSAQGP